MSNNKFWWDSWKQLLSFWANPENKKKLTQKSEGKDFSLASKLWNKQHCLKILWIVKWTLQQANQLTDNMTAKFVVVDHQYYSQTSLCWNQKDL